MNKSRNLLLSIDLEDSRLNSLNGNQYPSRVEQNTLKFLDFLDQQNLKCTFFTVGNIFRNHPDLIKEVLKRKHELAWHSDEHQPVAEMTAESFYKDLCVGKNLSEKFGFNLYGYRAPIFSVNNKTPWFHKQLSLAGFKYSSSVLPAKNPLYGWPEFGSDIKIINDIIEVPMSLVRLKILNFPFGGVYLRFFPSYLFSFYLKYFSQSSYVNTYVHPYDFDFEQERYIHGGINNNFLFNHLMYFNRKKMYDRLLNLIRGCGDNTSTYYDFIQSIK